MLKRYPQLQSGFIGVCDNALDKAKPLETSIVSNLVNKQPHHTQDDYFYAPEIDRLASDAFGDPNFMTKLENHERAINLIGALLDNKGLWHFIRLQMENPRFSQVHHDFLVETLGFIYHGKRRVISLPTWHGMLLASNTPSNRSFQLSQSPVKDFADFTAFQTLAGTIQQWFMYSTWHDLIFTMQVIYGRRDIGATKGFAR